MGHRLAKNNALWAEKPMDCDLEEDEVDRQRIDEPVPEASLNGPEARAEAELRKWAALWAAGEQAVEPPTVPEGDEDEEMEDITTEDQTGVAKSL